MGALHDYCQSPQLQSIKHFGLLLGYSAHVDLLSLEWGGKIGKECCLYPAGADPFMPEPDLVRMGDGCVIDCASIVCHLNTRGNSELQKIVIEDNCTLRTGSRVQQGVHMEQGSQLLEKSVAMTGEVIEAFSVWRGEVYQLPAGFTSTPTMTRARRVTQVRSVKARGCGRSQRLLSMR